VLFGQTDGLNIEEETPGERQPLVTKTIAVVNDLIPMFRPRRLPRARGPWPKIYNTRPVNEVKGRRLYKKGTVMERALVRTPEPYAALDVSEESQPRCHLKSRAPTFFYRMAKYAWISEDIRPDLKFFLRDFIVSDPTSVNRA
jgi:hypothetical protein